MKSSFKWFLIFGFLCLHYTFSFGQAGTLDSTFDSDGLDTSFFPGIDNGIKGIAIQPDNKIVAVGYMWVTGTHSIMAIARYNSDGSLDTTFNGTGNLTDSIFFKALATCVALQPDGKILVGGNTSLSNTNYAFVIRYNIDGTRDTTFGNMGITTTHFNGYDTPNINAIALFPDGRMVVGGFNGLYSAPAYQMDFAFLRYSNSGVLDTTFGISGLVKTNLYNPPQFNYGDIAYSIAVLPGNKIITGGMANFYGPENINPAINCLVCADFALVQYDSTGALDSTFNGTGKLTLDIASSYEYGHTVLLQPDGKILLGGFTSSNTSSSYCVLRFNSDGTPDNGFGNNGMASYSTPVWWSGGEIAMQTDGKIVLTGSYISAGTSLFELVRFDSTGVLDSTFGNNGMVLTDFGYQQNTPADIKIQADQKIVVAGFANNASSIRTFALARYLTDLNVGLLDFDKSETSSAFVYPNPIDQTAVLKYTLTRNESLTIQLADINGKLVKTFSLKQPRSIGVHKEELNFNNSITSGNYLLIINREQNEKVKPVTIKLIKK